MRWRDWEVTWASRIWASKNRYDALTHCCDQGFHHEVAWHNVQGTEQDVSKGGDGSVKKTILKKGSGWKMPTELDEVTIYYEGTLEDGTKFASTGKPFTFNVGQGQVIKSLDEAVPTMKKGERAKIVTSPSHAYGEQGSPPTIPPNAKLFIEVELVHWRTVTDLTGDGGVVKKVLEEGQGFDKPRGMDEVTLKYSVRAAETGSQLFTTGDDGQEMTLPSISNSGLKALVESMKKGEVADASFHRIHGGQNCAHSQIDFSSLLFSKLGPKEECDWGFLDAMC